MTLQHSKVIKKATLIVKRLTFHVYTYILQEYYFHKNVKQGYAEDINIFITESSIVITDKIIFKKCNCYHRKECCSPLDKHIINKICNDIFLVCLLNKCHRLPL